MLADKLADRVVVDVHGVGYEVFIPASTYYGLGEPGETVSLHVHTHVKEDALSLYGFLTEREKRLFSQLIQISGIGPKLAVSILSGMAVEDFLDAVMANDLPRLNGIPGVGRKTAERLLVEMRDRVLTLFPEAREVPASNGPGTLEKDVVSALVNLGYTRGAAEKSVSEAFKEGAAQHFEELFRSALRRIAS